MIAMIVMIATNVTIAMNAPATIGTMVATTASRCVHLNIECWRTLTTSNCLNFFLQDRRKNHDEDDTPEWFHGGPTSQHDTIELRGFDEEKDRSKSGKSGKKETAKERQIANGKKVDEAPLVNGSSRPGSSSSGKITKEDQSTSENNLKYNDESVMEIVLLIVQHVTNLQGQRFGWSLMWINDDSFVVTSVVLELWSKP